MKKYLKIILVSIIAFLGVLVIQNNVYAADKSYVENMDIQATIKDNGNLSVEQTITYYIDGTHNGMYITIPYNFSDSEMKEVIKNGKINDNIYNGDYVKVNKVSLINGSQEIPYTEQLSATNGTSGVYTLSTENKMRKIKVYCSTTNQTRKFKIYYEINNLCVKHNDVGELYYNFIGGAWDHEIKNLNIDIYLPNNNKEINVWGHGPYNGESKIVDNTHANFSVKNVKQGQYVAARMIFDLSNIANSPKVSHIDAKNIIYEDENAIIENKAEKQKFTNRIIIFTLCLLTYWIILLIIFEKDKKHKVDDVNEDELFEKYNPMLAGCIQGSRGILARDIIAVILNLIDKKYIKYEIKNIVSKKSTYTHLISKNLKIEDKIDVIEKYVYDWIFDNKDTVALEDRLEEMPKEKGANKKFKELNEIVQKQLIDKGANKTKVPMALRGFNIFLFILSLVLIFRHIMFNGLELYSFEQFSGIAVIILWTLLIVLPLGMGIVGVILNLIIIIRHRINKIVQKKTGQKTVTTTISLVVLFAVIIAITAIILPGTYLIADELLLCIATIIILTDNLMMKNDVSMIEDYSKLNALKNKIDNYTLMEDRDIEYITLWGKYLSYAVSFGIANKIMKRIKGLNIDTDLTDIMENDIMTDMLANDYYHFYVYASLDRVFMRQYYNALGKVSEKMFEGGSGGYSGGGGGGSSW